MAENNSELNEEDIIINDQDGLPNVHPNLLAEADIDSPDNATDDEFEDLPTSVIVTNIHDSVFTNPGKICKQNNTGHRQIVKHSSLGIRFVFFCLCGFEFVCFCSNRKLI